MLDRRFRGDGIPPLLPRQVDDLPRTNTPGDSGAAALQDPKREVVRITLVGSTMVFLNEFPIGRGDRREEGVSVDVGMDERQVDTVGQCERVAIDLLAARAERFLVFVAELDGCPEVGRDTRPERPSPPAGSGPPTCDPEEAGRSIHRSCAPG